MRSGSAEVCEKRAESRHRLYVRAMRFLRHHGAAIFALTLALADIGLAYFFARQSMADQTFALSLLAIGYAGAAGTIALVWFGWDLSSSVSPVTPNDKHSPSDRAQGEDQRDDSVYDLQVVSRNHPLRTRQGQQQSA